MRGIIAFGLLAAAGAASAQTPCRLCAPEAVQPAGAPDRPLTIEVEAGIDFSRLAVASGGGSVDVDPADGSRRVSGGLIDLGGLTLTGAVKLTGEPGRPVRVSLPQRVMLTTPEGGSAELRDIRTDLPAAARLGPDGRLSFAFGGRLEVSGSVSGQLRGRIPIVADYE